MCGDYVTWCILLVHRQCDLAATSRSRGGYEANRPNCGLINYAGYMGGQTNNAGCIGRVRGRGDPGPFLIGRYEAIYTLVWGPETDEHDSSWARGNLVFEYLHVFGTAGIKADTK